MKKIVYSFVLVVLVIVGVFMFAISEKKKTKVMIYPDFVVNICIDDVGNYKGSVADPNYRNPTKEDVEYMFQIAEKYGCALTTGIIFDDRELDNRWGWRTYFTWLPPLLRKHSRHEHTIHGRIHSDFVKEGMTYEEMKGDLLLCIEELRRENLKFADTQIMPYNVYDDAYLAVANELGIRTIRSTHLQIKMDEYNKIYRPKDGYQNGVWVVSFDFGGIKDTTYQFSPGQKEKYLERLKRSIDENYTNRRSPWSWMLHWWNFMGGEQSAGAIVLDEALKYIIEKYGEDTRFMTLSQTGEYFRELLFTKINVKQNADRIHVELQKSTNSFATPLLIKTNKDLVIAFKKRKVKDGWKIYVPKNILSFTFKLAN